MTEPTTVSPHLLQTFLALAVKAVVEGAEEIGGTYDEAAVLHIVWDDSGNPWEIEVRMSPANLPKPSPIIGRPRRRPREET